MFIAGPVQQASASVDVVEAAQQIIEEASGSTVLTGVAVSGCTASGICEAGAAVAVATVLGYSVWRLKALFSGGHTVESATVIPLSGTTTYSGGCWAQILSTSYSDCTTSARGAQQQDQISWASGFGPSMVMTIDHAPARRSTTDSLTVHLTWSGAPYPSGGSGSDLSPYCYDGTNTITNNNATGIGWNPYVLMKSASSGTVSHTFPASVCASPYQGWGGLQDTQFGHRWLTHLGSTSNTTPAPQHEWRAVKTCSSGGTQTAYSAQFREADDPLPIFPNPSCVGSALPLTYRVFEGDAAGLNGTQVLDWTAPASWASPSTVSYSDCLPGGSAAPCQVQLLKYSPSGLLQCTGGAVDCGGFDPATSTDTEYQCRWGTHLVGLTQCANAPRVDPSRTDTGTETAPVDPETPFSADPRQSVVECVGGVGWNPINWVVRPVVCALKYAFVPQQLGDDFASLKSDAEGRVPFTWISSVVAGGSAIGSTITGGCSPMVWNLPAVGPTTVMPCNVPFAGIPRNLEKLAVWLAVGGLFWRLAPWNKGRETGGPS